MNAPRCLYEPTESGLCATCGLLLDHGANCPATGGVVVYEGSTAHAARNLGDATSAVWVAVGDAIKPVLARIGDLLERTVEDDRS